MPDDFDRLIDRFLADEFEASPHIASAQGVEGYDHETSDLSAAAIEARAAKDAAWAERLAAFTDGDLTADQRVDRDLVVAMMAGRRVLHEWASWRRNPDVYLGAGLNGVFVLFLHRLRPEGELVDAACDRLRAVPATLARARENLVPDLASPVLLRRSLGQARAGARYARELVPLEVADDGLRARLADAGAVAAAAYDELAAFLEDLADRATGSHALGEDAYSTLLRQRELLAYGATELQARGRAAYAELDEEMQRLATAVGGTPDWRTVVGQLNADHPETPEAMRAEYERVTRAARAFLAEHGLVSFVEGEECRVVPSPHFQRPVLAVASYYRPPGFTASRTGHFFVPFPPDGTPADEVAKRLETNSFHTIPTVAVHEAYPGHHWHLVTALQNPRTVRRVLSSAYFTEGWALYAERMMREQGFFTDPRHELCHLDARIFRAARIVVDTSLHTGEMSVEEAVEFMHTKASLSEPTARAEVARYCAWPTQASSYLTGALEIERMRDDFVASGAGDLRTFHDTIAGSGCLPVALAERALAATASS